MNVHTLTLKNVATFTMIMTFSYVHIYPTETYYTCLTHTMVLAIYTILNLISTCLHMYIDTIFSITL